MPVVRPYPLPDVEARPIPNVAFNVPAAGDVGLFGGNQARDLQQAGQNLGQAADTTFGIYERAAKEANDTKVEADLNTFIAGKQKTLADFVQLKGEAAVQGSQGVTDGLLKSKQELLDGAKNAYQRDALSKRLDAQVLDATGTVTAHTANQATAWQKDTLAARSDLNGREAVTKRDDPAAVEGLLLAATSLGQEQARLLHGAAPDSDIAKEMALKEQEKYLVGVIQAKITDGNKRAALALYDKYPNVLKHNAAVDSVMKGVRTEIDGENVVNSVLAEHGLPLVRSGDSREGGGNGGSANKGQFIQKMMPHALEVSKATGLDPRLVIAQSALETGWGAGAPGNNYFGVKSHGAPGGQTLTTTEVGPNGPTQVQDSFRTYGGPRESASDYAAFLKSNSRYAPVLAAKGLDAQIEAMGKSGYATDPNYASKLRQIAQTLPNPHTDSGGEESAPFGGSIINARGGTPGAPSYKGDLKAGYDQASADIQNRTDLSPEVRAAALATLNKQATTITSYQASAAKALKDEADSYRAEAYVSPGGVDPAKMASFAGRAAALGEQSLATTYRMIASLAPTVNDTLQSMPNDRFNMLKSIEEGPAKKLLEGMKSGNADALAKANDTFSSLKKAHADGLDPSGLKDMATQAAQLYADAGKSEKAREVAQTYGVMIAASDVMKRDPVAQKQILADLEGIANKGQFNEEQVMLHGMVKDGTAKQETDFAKDAYSAGRKTFGMPTLPIADGTGRAQQAADIAHRRNLRPDQVATMSEEEFSALRSQMGASPQAAQKLVSDIAANYPPETIPLIGAGIAGKGLADPVSMGYAAAISFAADKEPEVAATILDGVNKRKTMGDALSEMPKSDAFHQAVQDKMGNAFKNLPGNVPALIVKAAEAIYTSKMVAAGRQGEKRLDDTVFQQALDAVSGKPIMGNGGQMFVPPKGVSAYQFDNALRQLSNDNMVGLVTENGSPVTTEKMVRYGMFSNAGKDGLYFVEMNDPARGGRPSYVVSPGPKHEPLVIDIKPLLEAERRNPGTGIETPNSAKDARRRAPASPTANVEP